MRRILSVFNSPLGILVSRLAVAALGLISGPIIAHGLGPSGRGETAASLAALFLAPIVLAIGMPLEIRRRVLADGDFGAVRTSRVLSLFAVVPACLIGWLVDATVLNTLDEPAAIAAFIGIAVAPVMVSWMCDTGVLIAQRRYAAVALMQGTQPVIFVAGIATLFLVGQMSVAGVLWCSIAGNLATGIMGLSLNRVSLRGDRAPWRGVVRGSFTFYGAQASEAAYQRLDQVIMLPILGSYQSGLYSIAVTIGTLPVFLAHAVASPVFADVSNSIGRRRDRLTAEAIRSALLMGIGFAIVLAVISPFLVPILFGTEFSAALPAVNFAILGSIFLVMTVSATEVLSARNKGYRLTIAQVSGLVVVTTLIIVFGPTGGALAASIANASGLFTSFVIMMIAVGVPVKSLIPRPSDVRLVLRRMTSHSGAA